MNTHEDKGVAVYCSSSTTIDNKYLKAAYDLGVALTRAGLSVINGGGKMSMMAAVNDGALQSGGTAIGVIPRFMYEADRHHKGLTELIITEDMHQRKATMAKLAQAVIALPGSVGTLDELAEMMTWRKLGLFKGKVIILNLYGYYDELIAWLRKSEEQNFTTGEPSWLIATSIEQAISLITNDNEAN